MTGDYRAHSDRLREIQASFQTTSRAVQDMEAELAEINERLSQCEKKSDDSKPSSEKGAAGSKSGSGKAGLDIKQKY